MRRLTSLLVVVLAGTGASWVDRWEHARTGNRLYDEGKYDDAAQAYNQGLTEDPDSSLLHFNLGAAQYKQGQYDAALKTLQQVPVDEKDPERGAQVAYNAGNAAYKQGTTLAEKEPQKALEQWAQALAFYRRALGLRPDDVDTKFNYEFVRKQIDDLRQKMEDQKKQQDQQKQDQKDKQDKKDQDQKQDQQGDKSDKQKQDEKQDQQGDQKGEDKDQPPPSDQGQQGDKPDEKQQQQAQPQPPADQKPSDQQQATGGEPDDQQQPEGEGGESDSDIAGQKKDGEMSKREAAALLDGQRGEEVQPDEVVKRMQGAKVGRPARDW